jgi:DNA-binding response OmpR family regulator
VRAAPRILVVDDEPGVQQLLSVVFRAHGYVVDTASHGEEAMQRIDAHPPNLILLDLMMPRMDGWAVLEALRRRPDAPPIILLSAYGNLPETAERATMLGARACLPKPFKFPDLLATCEAALRQAGGNGG